MPKTQVSINDTELYPPQMANDPGGSMTDPSFWGGLVGTILLFLLILVVALWVIRKMNQASFRGMQAPWARVLDRQMLNTGQSLYLVEIAGKLQILGGTDHHLIKIDEINDPELAAEILDELAQRTELPVEGLLSAIARRILGGKRRSGKDPFAAELDRLLEEAKR